MIAQRKDWRNGGENGDLKRLIDQFEKVNQALFEAVQAGDEAAIGHHDKEVQQLFDQILNFPTKENKDKILLAEFLLDHLQVENLHSTDQIKSKIVDILRNALNA